MKDAKIKLADREINLVTDVTTIGRTGENTIAFPDDANLSRHHAEIELRDGAYYLIDLQSSNGTLLNGQLLKGEKRLESGDRMIFGGTSHAQFLVGDDDGASKNLAMPEAAAAAASNAPAAAVEQEKQIESETAAAPPSRSTTMVAAAVCGVAVLAMASAGAVYYFKQPKPCTATAVIVKPENSDVIQEETQVEVTTTDDDCVSFAKFRVGGIEIASTKSKPFTTTLDPNDPKLQDLDDGGDYPLEIVLYDEKGEIVSQSKGVELAFNAKPVATPTPEIVQETKPGSKTSGGSQVSLRQIEEMSRGLVKDVKGGNYKFNQQFLQEIQKKTGEYSQAGFVSRAAPFRDPVNLTFSHVNVEPSLAYFIAMSRSKYNLAKQGDNEGLWQLPGKFVADLGYDGGCTTSKSLSDPKQECAIIAASEYLRAILPLMGNDPVYAAAVFGKSPQEAATFQASLPPNRDDIGANIKTPAEREQVVRFFAAGIVALNPQKFGLNKDQPLSVLYSYTQ